GRADLVQVHPEHLEQFGLRSTRPDLGGQGRSHSVCVGNKSGRIGGKEVVAAGERQKEVFGAQPAVPSGSGLLERGVDDQLRGRVAALEHAVYLLGPRRTWCFLCTDWRVTPSASAMACQDQPTE